MIPQPLSPGEETFALHCQAHNLTPVREHCFHPKRKWRFDFCWPEKMLAVEIEGGIRRNGRHNRGVGYEGDLYKYNAAVNLGWRVLRYSTAMVRSGHAIDEVRAMLE